MTDYEWRSEAACAGADPERFILADHEHLRHGVPPRLIDTAATFCARCPVREQCAAEAAEGDYIGLVYGGVLRTAHAVRDLVGGTEVRRR